MPAGFESLDFHAFHRAELPRRLAAGNGAIASGGLRKLGALAFRLPDGDAYSYVPQPGGVDVVAGDASADTVVELSRESWEQMVHELETAPGLLYAGRVEIRRGDGMHFVGWEPALRAMFHGRPIYDPDHARLEDLRGQPLDPERGFELGDDREEMAHFLRTAGYLHAKNVLGPEEVESLLETGARMRAQARPGDKRSWWGKNASGEEVLCRVTHCGRVPELRSLYSDRRILDLVELSDYELVARADDASEQGATVLFKNPDMTEGLSDLPWHRDCGMGGHATMCPTLVVSLYLTASTPESGELRFLPGSWQGSFGFFEAEDPAAPQGVAPRAGPGDVTLHYGDGMHVAPPPKGPGPYRTCVLLGFAREDSYNHRGDDSYNDVLLSRDDGQVEHLQKVVDRS